jgi:uncharacterized protein YybS (DUF2232 family)
VAGVVLPLPVLLAGWRLGARAALLLALAAALLVFSLKPGLDVVLENLGAGQLLFMGVLLSVLHGRGMPPQRAIILTVAVLTLTLLLFLAGQALLSGMTPQAFLAQKSGEIMETLSKVMGGGGGSSGLLLPDLDQAEVETLVQRLLPGLIVANTGLVAWINVILARQLAFRLGWGEPKPPLFYWSTPEWLIFVVLGGGFLLLVPLKVVRFFSLNLLIVLGLLYFCQGVAVVAAWFHRWGLPRFFRLVGYALLFLNPLFFLIVTVGLMDLWLDFRRLHQPKDA